MLPLYPPYLPLRLPTGCDGGGPSLLKSDPSIKVTVPADSVLALTAFNVTLPGNWAAIVRAAARSVGPPYSTTDYV